MSNIMAMVRQIPTTRVGGLNIAAIGLSQTADLIIEMARARTRSSPPALLTSANGQVLSLVARDPQFRRLCEDADLVSADGQPMVIASRLLARDPLPERVATTDLFHDVAVRAERAQMSFYLLGASEYENAKAVASVQSNYPALRIAGAQHGFFPVEEETHVVQRIAQAQPDILWVSLGVPREQEFIIRHRDQLRGVGVAKTSGGLFNFLSGTNSRAPMWMQRAGLEWLHRTCLEPQRLGRRYASTNVHALYLLLCRTGSALGSASRTSR